MYQHTVKNKRGGGKVSKKRKLKKYGGKVKKMQNGGAVGPGDEEDEEKKDNKKEHGKPLGEGSARKSKLKKGKGFSTLEGRHGEAREKALKNEDYEVETIGRDMKGNKNITPPNVSKKSPLNISKEQYGKDYKAIKKYAESGAKGLKPGGDTFPKRDEREPGSPYAWKDDKGNVYVYQHRDYAVSKERAKHNKLSKQDKSNMSLLDKIGQLGRKIGGKSYKGGSAVKKKTPSKKVYNPKKIQKYKYSQTTSEKKKEENK